MRATINDLRRHPTWIGSWLYELPYRRRDWWRNALLAEGEGWLRFAPGERMGYENLGEGLYNPEYWRVAPPLRRLYEFIRWSLIIPRVMFKEHLSWEEAAPAWECLRADPERRKELWHHA